MIKSLSSSGNWLNVSGGINYVPSSYSNNGIDGQMRFNTQTQNTEVYSSGNWSILSSPADINPSGKMMAILEWAERQMNEEAEIAKLVETNPTVADAYQAYQHARDQLKIVTNLVKTHS
jgi:hypothetical protein